MPTYIALIDGEPGAYGAVFPDAPGCTAMGKTVEEALSYARLALAKWVEHSQKERLGIARTEDELLADPEVVEQLEGGAVSRVV